MVNREGEQPGKNREMVLALMETRGVPDALAEWIYNTADQAATRAVEGVGAYLEQICGETPPLLVSCIAASLLRQHLAAVDADIAEQLRERGEDPAAIARLFAPPAELAAA